MPNLGNKKIVFHKASLPIDMVGKLHLSNKTLMQYPEKIMLFGSCNLLNNIHRHNVKLPINILNESVILVTTEIPTSYDEPAISKILSVKKQWQEILSSATNSELELIIANDKLIQKNVLKDNVKSNPPFSFPGKILALLFNRYIYFSGNVEKGLSVILENKDNNSHETLESIVLELAHLNGLDPLFLDWIENANQFYSCAI